MARRHSPMGGYEPMKKAVPFKRKDTAFQRQTI